MKMPQLCAAYKKLISNIMVGRLKVKVQKKIYHVNIHQEKIAVAILITAKQMTGQRKLRNNKIYYIMKNLFSNKTIPPYN